MTEDRGRSTWNVAKSAGRGTACAAARTLSRLFRRSGYGPETGVPCHDGGSDTRPKEARSVKPRGRESLLAQKCRLTDERSTGAGGLFAQELSSWSWLVYREVDGYRPIQKLGTLDVVSAQAKEAVVALVRDVDLGSSAGMPQSKTNIHHPERGDGHSEDEADEGRVIGQPARAKIETAALPIAKHRLDPEAFASAAPSMTVGRQIGDKESRPLVLARPPRNDVDRPEGVQGREKDVLVVHGISVRSDCQVDQRHFLAGLHPDPQVALESQMPVPSVVPAVRLKCDGPKFGIAIEHDSPARGNQGLDLPEQLDLAVGSRAAHVEDFPDQGQHPLAIGYPDYQDTAPWSQVGAIHHQANLHPRPISQQLNRQGPIRPCPTRASSQTPPQPLDQAVPSSLQRQHQGQGAQSAIWTLSQSGTQHRQIPQLRQWQLHPRGRQASHQLAITRYTVHQTLLVLGIGWLSPLPYHTRSVVLCSSRPSLRRVRHCDYLIQGKLIGVKGRQQQWVVVNVSEEETPMA